MPLIKVWIHYIWAAKKNSALLAEPVKDRLFEHLRQHARGRRIYIDRINGSREFLHCLVALDAYQTIEKTVKFLKGESSFWFNSQWGRTIGRLSWQEEYMAVSISESAVPAVRAYIDAQPVCGSNELARGQPGFIPYKEIKPHG